MVFKYKYTLKRKVSFAKETHTDIPSKSINPDSIHSSLGIPLFWFKITMDSKPNMTWEYILDKVRVYCRTPNTHSHMLNKIKDHFSLINQPRRSEETRGNPHRHKANMTKIQHCSINYCIRDQRKV